jgi:hypothetical protein
MSCTAAKITFEACGHTAHHIISCCCGKGWKVCNFEQCRIILSTSYPSACHKDAIAQQHYDERRSRDCFHGRVSRFKQAAGARDPRQNEIPFEIYCIQTLGAFHEEELRLGKRKFRRRYAEIERASDWTKYQAQDLHAAMFGPKHEKLSAVEDLKEWLVRLPGKLTILEHGCLSKMDVQQLARMNKPQRRAFLGNMRIPKAPMIPLFPGQVSKK